MGLFAKIKGAIMASTATKIATAAAVVVVLGGSTAGLAYAGVFTSAEAAVGTALVHTFTDQTSSAEEIFGIKALSMALEKQGSEKSLEIILPEILVEELELLGMTLPELGFRLDVKTTPTDTINAVLDIKAANTTLLSCNAYCDMAQLQVSVPKLSDSVLVFPYGNPAVEEQLKDSYAAAYLGLTEEQIELLVDNLPKQNESVPVEEIRKRLLEILTTAFENHLTATEFEKAGKAEIKEDNLVQKCRVYTIKMNAEQFTEFLSEVAVRTGEYLKELCTAQGMNSSILEVGLRSVDNELQQLKASLRDTVTWTCYVSEKRLVRLHVGWLLAQKSEAESSTMPGGLELVLAAEGNPLENMEVSLKTPICSGDSPEAVPQSIDLHYAVVTENTEDTYSTQYSVKSDEEEGSLRFAYEKLSGDFYLEADGWGQKHNLTGVVGELEKGRKIGLELVAYKYTEGEISEEHELDVSIAVKTLEEETAPLQGAQQDVLKMTKDDFAALEEEISQKLTMMLFSIMGLFQ